METVLHNGSADSVLTGGLVGQIMLLASGCSLGETSENFIKEKHLDEFIPLAERLLKKYPEKLMYPEDVAIVRKNRRMEVDSSSLPADGLIVDIGGKTAEKYGSVISKAGTIFMNGPAGVYEEDKSILGTRTLWENVASSKAFSIIGGGDTIAASKKFGVDERISYICTAGGGLVRFLSGEKLPVIQALKENSSP